MRRRYPIDTNPMRYNTCLQKIYTTHDSHLNIDNTVAVGKASTFRNTEVTRT